MDRVKYLRLIPLSIFMLLLTHCKQGEIQSYSTVKYQPAGALQLDPGVFLDSDSLARMGLKSGDVVDVMIDSIQIQANAYPYTYKKDRLGMNRFMLDKLGMKSGSHEVYIAKATKPTIPAQPLAMHGESYLGDINKWGHFVISAPHGDCDLFTGEIVQALTKNYDIPTAAFYHPRFTFLGRWYDANRPLGKAPREDGHWTIPERIWNTDIDSVYRSYETIIRNTAQVEPGQALDFLCSFHGHDLKMKDAVGNRINREVIEAYGSGFTQAEYREMIQIFNRVSQKHFDKMPLLVFGNLPEHQQYEINGQIFNFWYTGLGTRTYGTLRKSNTIRGLHMETPNSLRFDPADRSKTITVMAEFFQVIHDKYIYPFKTIVVDGANNSSISSVVDLPEVTFTYRKRKVSISAIKMGRTEVSIAQYAQFLNEQISAEKYEVDIENRSIIDTMGQVVCHFDAYHEGDMLSYKNGSFQAEQGRKNHPITNMTWYSAMEYAKYVDGRLPTETEWVRAAGYWNNSLHTYAAMGDEYPDYEQQVNFEGSDDPLEGSVYPQSLPVGFLSANGNGLHEMSGNVWEWCADWYHSKYFKNLDANGISQDPTGPESGTMRTMKGGSWGAGVEVTKVGYRVALSPSLTSADLGFRVVWDN